MKRLGAFMFALVAAAGCAREARASNDEPLLDFKPLVGQPERNHRIWAGLGGSILKVNDKSTHSTGPGAALGYSYQFTDALCLIGEFSSSIVARSEDSGPNIPHTRPTGVSSLGVGPGYILDVSQHWFPYGAALASGWALTGGNLDKPVYIFGLQLAVGVDYMFTPHFGLGLAVREHLMLTKMDTYPNDYSGFLRAVIVWGR